MTFSPSSFAAGAVTSPLLALVAWVFWAALTGGALDWSGTIGIRRLRVGGWFSFDHRTAFLGLGWMGHAWTFAGWGWGWGQDSTLSPRPRRWVGGEEGQTSRLHVWSCLGFQVRRRHAMTPWGVKPPPPTPLPCISLEGEPLWVQDHCGFWWHRPEPCPASPTRPLRFSVCGHALSDPPLLHPDPPAGERCPLCTETEEDESLCGTAGGSNPISD